MPNPNLVVTRVEANNSIDAQIKRGNELQNLVSNDYGELRAANEQKIRWTARNIELMARIFDNDSISREFWRYRTELITDDNDTALEVLKGVVREQTNHLEAVKERLDLIPEVAGNNQNGKDAQPAKEIELPEKITAAWLYKHAPVHFWFSAFGIIIASFLAGATVGQTTFIQELLGKKQTQNSTQPATSFDSTKQTTGTIKGVVMGNGGSPLPGANVIVKVNDTFLKTVYQSNTDINGLYITPRLQPNKYIIYFDYNGYSTSRIEATVTADSEIVINARLESSRPPFN